MTFKKTKIAMAVATATLALASSSAMAHSKAERIADATAKKTAALEAQVQQMASMMQAMQAELSRVKAQASTAVSSNSQKLQELDQWMASVKSAPVHVASKDNLIAARGGWMHFNDNRDGTDTGGLDFGGLRGDRDAYYYGGAIDFNVNNDLFGFMDHTSFAMELGVEYAHIANNKSNTGILAMLGARANKTADVNQLRISIAPKIKFMHGSKLRPWIIPAGLDINIISPPSNAITVLNTGMQFGAGVNYELFNGIVAGVDGRYHHSFDNIDGVDTDGFTLGGSLGFRF
ncbi:hypothetical protein [methane-oxidizing endosymbiont of Gigantopelta aegis]|uniref:hypothetical protein n=1 Tax=methane-oxidizing endosymbiont of Gigantopelta aegis TaxID=2794938 RepID=UPI0018DBA415|nr:hypothetical protein [methane-oxidizing endosymbiont of Gigantopelta aegis]